MDTLRPTSAWGANTCTRQRLQRNHIGSPKTTIETSTSPPDVGHAGLVALTLFATTRTSITTRITATSVAGTADDQRRVTGPIASIPTRRPTRSLQLGRDGQTTMDVGLGVDYPVNEKLMLTGSFPVRRSGRLATVVAETTWHPLPSTPEHQDDGAQHQARTGQQELSSPAAMRIRSREQRRCVQRLYEHDPFPLPATARRPPISRMERVPVVRRQHLYLR